MRLKRHREDDQLYFRHSVFAKLSRISLFKSPTKKKNKNALAYLIVYIPTPTGPRASNAYLARLPPFFFLVQSGARQAGPPLLLLLPAGGTAP